MLYSTYENKLIPPAHWQKHVSISHEDFRCFKIIGEKLVEQGVFKSEYPEKFVVS